MPRQISYKRLFVIGTVGFLVITAPLLLIYLFYDKIERDLRAGEGAYAQGVQALESERYETAEAKFEEAVLLSNKVLDATEAKFNTKLKEDERQRLVAVQGAALWLKARAMRDRAFAHAAAEGKPLAETTDTTLGVKFRSVLLIPDVKERGEALTCQRQAATILPGNDDVQREALRTETMLSPVSWVLVERFAQQELALDENSSRALQQLTLYHYEQPQIDAKGGQRGPTPLSKRSEKRMQEARDYLERLKKSPTARYWRTAELDAKITLWMRDSYAEKGKAERQAQEAKRLEGILDEARKRSRDEKQIAGLSIFDLRGLTYLRRLELEDRTRSAMRHGDGAKAVAEQLEEILALCQRFVDARDDASTLEECATSAARALAVAQPVARTNPGWKKWLEGALALADRAREKVNRPAMYAEMVRLLDSEARLAGSRGDADGRKKYEALADKWLDDGLAAGKKAGLSEEQMAELHLLAANRKALKGATKTELRPHLDLLRKSTDEATLAYVAFLEGVALERQGRLEQARLKLEEAEAKGLPVQRSDPALASIYLALNRPTQALARLARLVKIHDRLDQMAPLERAWAAEFFRSREDLDAQRVAANLQAGLNEAVEFARDNPGKPLPKDVAAVQQKEAERLLGGLPKGSTQRHYGLLSQARFLTALSRREEADKVLTSAAREFPDSLDVLQARAQLLLLEGAKPGQAADKKQIARVDDLFRAHVTKHRDDPAAGLLWASWLSRTERAAEAVKYLEDPANFPGEKDDRYRAVLALALMSKGDRDASAEVLKQLPSSPQIDAALVYLAGSPAEQSKRLEQALSRHDRSGLLRCLQGSMALQKGQFQQAAEAFYQALEVTQVRNTAEAGLGQALVLWIGQDAGKARERIAEMLAETPNQKVPYLCYAVASLQLDDVGAPADSWGAVKNMSSALKAWEPLWAKEAGDQLNGPLTCAAFWRLAGREDVAWGHAERALEAKPASPEALRVAAVLALQSALPARRGEAEGLIARLEKVAPESPIPLILRARLNLRERKRAAARPNLEAALKKAPDNEEAAALLGQLMLDEKEARAAVAHARSWLRRAPASQAAAELLVRALAQDSQLDEARAEARAYSAERVEEVKGKQAKAKRPAEISEEDWKKGQRQAVARLERELKIAFARSLAAAGAHPAAEALLKEVLEKEPDDVAALQLLGDVTLARQDWKAARAAYKRAYEKQPRNLVAVNNLAWLAAEKLGDLKEALAMAEVLQKGRNGEPLGVERLPPDALDTLGVVYAKARDVGLYPRMRDLFEAAARRYPMDPRMSLFLGHAYAGLDDVRKARTAYDAAIQKAAKEGALDGAQRQGVRRQAEEAKKRLEKKS
jgi:Flp pilus assembly protein TadD